VTNYGYALIVVDMQNGFCHPEGSFSRIGLELEGAQDAVRNAALAVKQARTAGVPVIFTRHIYRLGRGDRGPSLIRNSPAIAVADGLAAGSWDADVVAELECRPDDLKVDKVRFDAFQWSSLEPLLRGLEVTDVMICGVVTNLCVESTVRSAFMRDIPVTLIEDACAANTRRLHELSIEVLSSYEIAEIVSISRGFDAGDPRGGAGRLVSPVRASERVPSARVPAARRGDLDIDARLMAKNAILPGACLAGRARQEPGHHPPAEEEEAEEAQRDNDERHRRALAGYHAQQHAERDRAQPGGNPRWPQLLQPRSRTVRPARPLRSRFCDRERPDNDRARPADHEAGQERPRRRGDAGQLLALSVAGPADYYENEYAAEVEES
jgi:nicotinamidase-related amidase